MYKYSKYYVVNEEMGYREEKVEVGVVEGSKIRMVSKKILA